MMPVHPRIHLEVFLEYSPNLPVTETLSLPFGRENKMAKQEQDINKEEAAEEEEQKVE